MCVNQKVKTILLIVINYFCLVCFTYFVFIGFPLWNGFFYLMFLNYKYNVIVTMFPIFIVIESLFQTFGFIMHRRCKTTKSIVHNDIALIIPCHNSEGVIGKTLECAGYHFKSSEIFVMDNGRSLTPTDKTPLICVELGVNYKYVPIPNKLTAIYEGIKLAKDFDKVVQIDDDVLLPKELEMKDDVDCIAFTIGATNTSGEMKLIQRFQDIEYKTAGIINAFGGKYGSALFPHGAVSLWRRDRLQMIIERHPMYPISEDWFVGYIANDIGCRIIFKDNVFVLTDVPDTYFGSIISRTSGYGSNSLWNQRFRRWNRLVLLQTAYLVFRIFCKWTMKRGILRELIFKLNCCWIVIYTVLVIFRYVLLAYNLIFTPLWTCLMYAIDTVINMINILIVNYYHLKKEERQPLYVVLLYQFYKIYDIFVMIVSCVHSYLFYLPIMLAQPRYKLGKK